MEPIHAEEWIEEEVPVEPGGTLYVDLDRGSVRIESHDASTVRVVGEARGWSASMATFVVEKVGNDVQLELSIDHWLPGLFTPVRVEVAAWVPREYNVEVGTSGGRVDVRNIGGRVGVDTRGGRINVNQVRGRALLRTSGGAIEAREIGGDVRAKTSGGRVEVHGVSGSVEARTSGGSIALHEIRGEVDARTSGGGISLSFANEPWGFAQTSGGSIDVEYARGHGAEIDARTSGGRVKLEPSVQFRGRESRHRLSGQLESGGPPLKLCTSGGSIRLRAR